MKKTDIFIIALWAATVFGLLEGIVLDIARAYPALLAPYKASAHLLWIAPVVDMPLFLLAALGLLVLLRLSRRWTNGIELTIAYGFFACIGAFSVIEAPKILNVPSTLLLSIGLGVVAFRSIRGSEGKLTQILRRRLLWIPVLIVLLGLGVFAYERASEAWRYRQLTSAIGQWFGSLRHLAKVV